MYSSSELEQFDGYAEQIMLKYQTNQIREVEKNS